MRSQKPLIFSTVSYDPLRRAIEKSGDFTAGRVERKDFPDGERYHRLISDVYDREVVLVGGTTCSRETMELFDMANAIVDYGALRLKVAVPYFGYSTMERAVGEREAVKAKYRARLLSAIPRASFGNRFFFVDLHSEGIPHYMEAGAQAVHVYAKPIVLAAAGELARKACAERVVLASRQLEVETAAATRTDAQSFVLASTDAGRAKWVESLAKELGVPPAFAYKRRLSGAETESLGIGGTSVEGAFVIIYDDMCRTGSSVKKAARAYLDAGAYAVAAIFTHGIFPGTALEDLRNERYKGDVPLLTGVVCTDTHPRVLTLAADGFLTVKSVAKLLAAHLRNGGRGLKL